MGCLKTLILQEANKVLPCHKGPQKWDQANAESTMEAVIHSSKAIFKHFAPINVVP